MSVRRLALALGLSILAPSSHAQHGMWEHASLLAPSQFRLPSADLGGTPNTRGATLPASISTGSFEVGQEFGAARLMHPQAFHLSRGDGGEPSFPSFLRLQKELPFGFDIGAYSATLPGSALQLVGAQARYALVPHNVKLPTIGLRASYSTLKGNDWLGIRAHGIDLSLSKGFSLITPYAGFGSVWVDSDSRDGAGWSQERFQQDKYFVGAQFNLKLVNLAVEADRTGDSTNYHARFGWRW